MQQSPERKKRKIRPRQVRKAVIVFFHAFVVIATVIGIVSPALQ